MPEDIDFSKAIEQLKDMLSSSEGESQIQNILGMIVGGQESSESIEEKMVDEDLDKGANIFSGLGDMQNILKIKNILGAVEGRKNDSSAAFLHALKPFLSENRQAKIENAEKILSMTKVFKILKDSGWGCV